MNEYKWAPGSRLTNKTLPAQVAGNELESLQQQNGGRLTARVVLDAARPIEAPLHPAFEWDDLKAAELFREDQARHVLSAIRIGPMDTKKAAVETAITIPPIDVRQMEVTLVGDSPLICHRWSEKAKKEMLDKQMKKAKTSTRLRERRSALGRKSRL